MGGPTAVVDDPPDGSIGSILRLPEALENLMFGQNVDMTPEEFLLHTGTSYAQRVDHHIQQYRATIYTIGIIAGVVGTKSQRDEILAAIEAAIRQYGQSLAEQNRRESWYSDFNTPIDVLSTAAGGIEAAWGGLQRGVGMGIESAGEYFESDTVANAGRTVDAYGQEDISEGIDTIYTNYDGMAVQMVTDLWNSIVDGAKEWWNWFTDTVGTEGLIIALGQAHVDASFLVAEIAIDVAIGMVTAGWGGAAFRAIRIVGRRVLDGATDVVVKLVREGAEAIDVKHLRHADSDIPADIEAKVPDLEDMQGHPDVKADTTPNADTPTTTRVAGGKGDNEVEWELDSNGHVDGAEARLSEDFGTTKRSSAERRAQSEAGRGGDRGLSDDDGGHVIGHRFVGDQGPKNLFPQNFHFNRGPYNQIEAEWGRAIAAGNEVEVKVKLLPPGQARPDRVEIEWQYFDEDGNPIGRPNAESFPNEYGNNYTSTAFRD